MSLVASHRQEQHLSLWAKGVPHSKGKHHPQACGHRHRLCRSAPDLALMAMAKSCKHPQSPGGH